MGTNIVLFVAECVSSPALALQSPPHLCAAHSDLGYNNIGYHNAEYRTPTLDALAAGASCEWQ